MTTRAQLLALMLLVSCSGASAISPSAADTVPEHRQLAQRLLQDPMLWLISDGAISHYGNLHVTEFQGHEILQRSGPVQTLNDAASDKIADLTIKSRLGAMPLKRYVQTAPVDGLIIVQGNRILFEAYPRMEPDDYHLHFSVSKVLIALAIGILEDQNRLDSQQAIDHFFPILRGSGWEGVRIIDILAMSSGINCPEKYTYPEGKCYLQTREAYGWPVTQQALANPLEAYARMSSKTPPGTLFDYTSVNSQILTLLVEAISGTEFADFIEENVWKKIGAENIALLMQGAYGRDASWIGMNSTLRDLARLGMLFTPSGRRGRQPVISEAHLDRVQHHYNRNLQTRSWFSDEQKYNGYQWDEIYPDGDFYKHGHDGQGLYVSPSRDMVIAFFGTADDNGNEHELPAIARQLMASYFNNSKR